MFGVLKCLKESLKFRKKQLDTALELNKVFVRSLIRWSLRSLAGKICFREDGMLTILAHPDIDRDLVEPFFGLLSIHCLTSQ